MKMIPSSPHGTNSRAEKRVFDRLREAFEGVPGHTPVAFHSFNLTRHASKRFGEADFLLCGPQGLFVLEVKGGGISCHGDRWKTKDRSGAVHPLYESPFRQAESALHAIKEVIYAKEPKAKHQLTVGYGVIFPDCRFNVNGGEWDRTIVADERDVRDLEGWLLRLFRYWRERDPRRTAPDPGLVKKLIRFLRPEFDVAVPLHVLVRDVEENVASLTEDQMAALDIIDANPRVLCEGGAGTGKTFLGMELARRWTESGAKVALICRSPWLKRYLETRFQVAGLSVALANNLKVATKRAGVDRFGAVIIDEGQDLFNMTTLDHLDAVVEGGLPGGKWCIFHDMNNQSGLFGPADADALSYLESLGAAKVPLRTNCRNTRVILDKVKSDLGADMGVRGTGEGPAVQEHRAGSPQDAARILKDELDEFIKVGELSAGQVTILSPLKFENSCAALLPTNGPNRISVLDEFSMRSFPPNHVSFSEITAFKGLENEAIILIDLPNCGETVDDCCLRYVGMSRARAVLSIISVAGMEG